MILNNIKGMIDKNLHKCDSLSMEYALELLLIMI